MGPAGAASARQRACAAIAEHAPAYGNLPVAVLGAGLDHQAFLVGDLVVRVGAGVAREAALLRLVAAHLPIPVPRPRFADPARGVLAYPLLPGGPLLGRTPPAGAAAQLGRMLAELHAIDPTPVDVPVEAADPQEWLADLAGPPELVRVLHADPPPTFTESVLAHADLGAEHLLAADGLLTGVIDWSDAAVTDRALDFARLYRDFGRRSSTRRWTPTAATPPRSGAASRSSPAAPRSRTSHTVTRPTPAPPPAAWPGCSPHDRVEAHTRQAGTCVVCASCRSSAPYDHAATISPSTPAKPRATTTRYVP
jgi:aminoglycoside phosphotransferase (APT) family kinase protein